MTPVGAQVSFLPVPADKEDIPDRKSTLIPMRNANNTLSSNGVNEKEREFNSIYFARQTFCGEPSRSRSLSNNWQQKTSKSMHEFHKRGQHENCSMLLPQWTCNDRVHGTDDRNKGRATRFKTDREQIGYASKNYHQEIVVHRRRSLWDQSEGNMTTRDREEKRGKWRGESNCWGDLTAANFDKIYREGRETIWDR